MDVNVLHLKKFVSLLTKKFTCYLIKYTGYIYGNHRMNASNREWNKFRFFPKIYAANSRFNESNDIELVVLILALVLTELLRVELFLLSAAAAAAASFLWLSTAAFFFFVSSSISNHCRCCNQSFTYNLYAIYLGKMCPN